ncbi:MAG: nucleoside-diphosphate sugar epimerase [bacterium]|nr:nucleoside-diphosphate sugar epimerase [bacterium]
MNSTQLFKKVWIISDGKIGDLVQCNGVAHALGIDAHLRIISPTKPWVWMMPYGPIPPCDKISNPQSPISQPLPDLVISAGWRTLAYVREIKKRKRDKVFTVYLKSPRYSADFLDLVWVPAHDNISGERIISSIASPHRFSPAILEDEFGEIPDYLAKLPRPLVGGLLGGDSKDYHFSDDDCARLAKSLRALCETGAGLAITPSRRSPPKLREAIEQQLAGMNYYWWDKLAPHAAPNPYGFLLAQSDAFVVTADSANMVGEACVTGKSVYVFKPSGGSKKFDRLLDKFSSHGATRPFLEPIEQHVPWSYEPLYAAGDIAAEIKKRALKQFGH